MASDCDILQKAECFNNLTTEQLCGSIDDQMRNRIRDANTKLNTSSDCVNFEWIKNTNNERIIFTELGEICEFDIKNIDVQAKLMLPLKDLLNYLGDYLTAKEVVLFCFVQKRYNDLICYELNKIQHCFTKTLSVLRNQWEDEKCAYEIEIRKLLSMREDQIFRHQRQVEKLRKYFEKHCAQVERQ